MTGAIGGRDPMQVEERNKIDIHTGVILINFNTKATRPAVLEEGRGGEVSWHMEKHFHKFLYHKYCM